MPIRARENAGRMSAPFLSQALHIIRPAIGVDLDMMAAAMVPAVDQHVTDAGGAHFTEGDHAKPHLRPEILTSEQALEQARALARAERDKGA